MKRILCHFCKTNEKTQVRGGEYCCDTCEPRPVFPCSFVNKVFIKGYGNVSEKRIGEMRRRVILPKEHDENGDYIVGRRDEHNKITDKTPTY